MRVLKPRHLPQERQLLGNRLAAEVGVLATNPCAPSISSVPPGCVLPGELDVVSEGGSDVHLLHGTLVILESRREESANDWRWQEVMGASASSVATMADESRAVPRAASTGAVHAGRRHIGARARGKDWREEELMGASAVSSVATALPIAEPAMAKPKVEVPTRRGRRKKAARGKEAAADKPDEDWRMLEVAGASASGAALAPPTPRHSSHTPHQGGAARRSGGWREEELFGASVSSLDAAGGSVEAPLHEASSALAETTAPEDVLPSMGREDAVEDAAEEGSVASEPHAAAAEGARQRPELGDLVVLGPGAPPEYRQCPGVVTKVAEAHCTVVVLDEAQRLGIGECWPSFADVTVGSRRLRVGSRVVIDGLQSARAKRLNGFSGTIATHPSKGHPTFISKPSAPTRSQLTICVGLDDPEAAGEKSVLLEPRFLVPYESYLAQAAGQLSNALASLRAAGALAADGTGTCAAAAWPSAAGPACTAPAVGTT